MAPSLICVVCMREPGGHVGDVGCEYCPSVESKLEQYAQNAEQARAAIDSSPAWLRDTAVPPRGPAHSDPGDEHREPRSRPRLPLFDSGNPELASEVDALFGSGLDKVKLTVVYTFKTRQHAAQAIRTIRLDAEARDFMIDAVHTEAA